MKKIILGMLIIVLTGLMPWQIRAAELPAGEEAVVEPDFSNLDQMLADEGSGLTLEDLFSQYMEGNTHVDLGAVGKWLMDRILGTLIEWKNQSGKLILLLLAFVLLRGLSDLFDRMHLTDFCFLAIYVLLLYQLLSMAYGMQQVAERCIDKITQFILFIQPLMCFVMVFASGMTVTNLTYELLVLVLYLVSHVLKYFLPLIIVYLLIEFANYAWTKEQFSQLAKLFRKGVILAQKVVIGMVFGINMIQSLVAPSVDLVRKNSVVKTVGTLPGVGGAINSVSELMLGTGLMIKNCVGVCVIIGLLVLFAGPLLEIGLMALFYQVLAAIVQPLTDKRVCGVLAALSRAGVLYFIVCFTAVLLVFLTVAILCMMTNVGM